jgi:hypothetical protein
MISKYLLEDLQKGYDLSCKEFQELILYRLNTRGVDIFEDLLDTASQVVKEYCESNSIDLLKVCNSRDSVVKEIIGLKIIEINIHKGIAVKAKKDIEIKELGLKTYNISNKIEDAPLLKLFGSPISKRGWTLNTSKIIDVASKEHPGYEKLVNIANIVRDKWIPNKEILPDIEQYNKLINATVPPEVQEMVNFMRGN